MQRFILPLLALILVSGCVKRGVHEEALEALAQRNADVAGLEADLADFESLAAELDAELAVCALDLEQQTSRLDQCQRDLNEARGVIAQGDEQMQALAQRLEDLSAVEQELRERDAIFRSIIERFQSLIDTGMLEVVVERGRLKLKLPQDILFEPGSADVGEDGERTLREVAGVLATLSDRAFQVEGHTDNVPITRRFDSNWELSAARALSVVHIFIDGGVNPANVSAAGFGEFQPRADNGAPEGRELNRRIEIVMVPNLERIFGSAVAP